LGPRNQSTSIESLTPEKIITTREDVTWVRDEDVGETKTNDCIACITKEIQITGQEIV
jgi:hypothetical protein